jgi:hypothetical protein
VGSSVSLYSNYGLLTTKYCFNLITDSIFFLQHPTRSPSFGSEIPVPFQFMWNAEVILLCFFRMLLLMSLYSHISVYFVTAHAE